MGRQSVGAMSRKQSKPSKKVTAVVQTRSLVSSGLARKSMMSVNLGSYGAMVKNPFSEQARGARFPDPYCFPTSTFRAQTTLVCSVGTTSATQLQAFVFHANPLVSYVDVNLSPTIGGSSSLSDTGGTTTFSNNVYVHGMSSLAELSNVGSQYRFVGGGLRLRMLTPEAVRTGRIYCAPIADTQLPGYNALTNTGTAANSWAELALCGGISPNLIRSAAVQNLPGCVSWTAQEMRSSDFDLMFRPHDPQVTGFKMPVTTMSINGNNNMAEEADYVVSTGAIAFADNRELTNQTGWNSWVVVFENFPQNQLSCQIDMVHHLEMTPLLDAVTGATGIQPIPSFTEPKKATHNFSDVLNMVADIPIAKVVKIAETVNNVYHAATGRGMRLT